MHATHNANLKLDNFILKQQSVFHLTHQIGQQLQLLHATRIPRPQKLQTTRQASDLLSAQNLRNSEINSKYIFRMKNPERTRYPSSTLSMRRKIQTKTIQQIILAAN
jgi:hypothetical protein